MFYPLFQDFLTFDAIRQSSQCVGRIIRSKRDYGIIVFAGEPGMRHYKAVKHWHEARLRHHRFFADRRYGNHDKRSKLPAWVQQFMPDSNINLSTDVAVHVSCRSRLFVELAVPMFIRKH